MSTTAPEQSVLSPPSPPTPAPQPGTKRILAHRILSWTTLILSIVFFILTVLYAWHPEYICRKKIFGGSPAQALQLLNVLSQIANFFLGASIGQCFDILRGMLVAREKGHCFMDNLALQPGTGLDGQLEIVRFGRNGARAWSLFKLVSMLVIPILGILILRDVQAIPIFYQSTLVPATQGYSIGAFNSSLAPLLQPLTDTLFGSRFKDFLSDGDLVADISTDVDRAQCSQQIPNGTLSICRTKYFVPGGIQQFAPHLLTSGAFIVENSIQVVLAKALRAYYLEFETTGYIDFDQQSECVRQGYQLGAYQLCLRSLGPNNITTYLTQCPKSVAASFGCLRNDTWPLDGGWGTTISVYSRQADVQYNGINGTILSYQFPNDTITPVNISATELLQVFDTLFSPADTTSLYGTYLSLLNISANRPVEPLTIWQYFQGLADLSRNNTEANRAAQIGLQSLLTIPIYHCQAKDFAELRGLLVSQFDNQTALGQAIVNLFPIAEANTDIYPAIMRYTLQVGRPSLISYVALAGCTLSLCLAVALMGSCTELGRKFKDMGPFPLLTHLCDCETVHERGRKRVEFEEWRGLGVEKMKKTGGMRVKLLVHREESEETGHDEPEVEVRPAEERSQEPEEPATNVAPQLAVIEVQNHESHESLDQADREGEHIVDDSVETVQPESLNRKASTGYGARQQETK